MGGGAPDMQPTPKVPGPNNKLQESKRRGAIKAAGDGTGTMNLMEDYISATMDPGVLKRTLGGE
jgi:hypothetical protein